MKYEWGKKNEGEGLKIGKSFFGNYNFNTVVFR